MVGAGAAGAAGFGAAGAGAGVAGAAGAGVASLAQLPNNSPIAMITDKEIKSNFLIFPPLTIWVRT